MAHRIKHIRKSTSILNRGGGDYGGIRRLQRKKINNSESEKHKWGVRQHMNAMAFTIFFSTFYFVLKK